MSMSIAEIEITRQNGQITVRLTVDPSRLCPQGKQQVVQALCRALERDPSSGTEKLTVSAVRPSIGWSEGVSVVKQITSPFRVM